MWTNVCIFGGENEKTKGLGGNVFPDTAAVVRFGERWDLSLSHRRCVFLALTLSLFSHTPAYFGYV